MDNLESQCLYVADEIYHIKLDIKCCECDEEINITEYMVEDERNTVVKVKIKPHQFCMPRKD